ncbi:MAG: alpha-amylase family glycosyl hydrolase, partial [Candidatus Acidiferrum sp.]
HHLDAVSPVKQTFYGKPEKEGNDSFELLADPHAPASAKRHLTDGWLYGRLPDLNTENPIVALYLLQNSIWWAESSGLDGYAVGAVPYVSRQFWAGWRAELRRIYPNLATIGEIADADPSVTSFFAAGQKRGDGVQPGIDTGFSTVFDFPMYFALRDVLLHGAPVGRIADVLRHDSLYHRPDLLVPFFGNGDVGRFASEPGSSPAKIKLAFGLTLTLRGIPELYYADEIGLSGGDNRGDFPGGWSGDAGNAFTQTGRAPEQQQIFSYVQALLRVRREHPALRGGRLWHLAADESSYVFLRESDEERLLVVFSNANKPIELRVPLAGTPAQGAARLTALFGDAKAEIVGREVRIQLPAQSLSIYELN